MGKSGWTKKSKDDCYDEEVPGIPKKKQKHEKRSDSDLRHIRSSKDVDEEDEDATSDE